jgi:hypothetical protein
MKTFLPLIRIDIYLYVKALIKVILFTLLLDSVSIQAQTTYRKFIEPNKVWDFYQCVSNSASPPPIWGCTQYYLRRFFAGDTLVNGISYNFIYQHDVQPTNPNSPYIFIINSDVYYKTNRLVREDTLQKKVYIYDTSNHEEYLWYDFTLAVGDTISVAMIFALNESSSGIIDSIDTITLLDGSASRIFYFYQQTGEYTSVIEGIGLVYGWGYHNRLTINGGTTLLCVKESNNPVYVNGMLTNSNVSLNDCFKHETSGIKEKTLNSISAYPNPGSDKVYIEELFTSGYTISIYNQLGQLISEKYCPPNTKEIDFSNLDNGFYSVLINHQGSIFHFKQIVMK